MLVLCLTSGCCYKAGTGYDYVRPNRPEVVKLLTKKLYELKAVNESKRGLSDQEKADFQSYFTLNHNQTLDVLEWGLKVDRCPCWKND